MENKSYDTIVLSGGASKGFGIVGSLQYLQDVQKLSFVKKFIGTSIGAIISYLVCIGYSPIEIMIISCQKQIFEKMTHIDMVNVMNGKGAVSFHIFQEILEKLTIEKIKKYITLQDLYTKYNKELVCCTYNMTLQKPEYLSYKTHPDLPCITALRMSSNLPFFFETFCYDDYKYIDGGIVDNFPISQVLSEDVALGIRTKKVLSIDPDRKEEDNLVRQFLLMLTIPIGHIEELQIILEKNKHVDLIDIPIPTYIAFSFNMSNTEKFDLFSIGYETIKTFFSHASEPNGLSGLE